MHTPQELDPTAGDISGSRPQARGPGFLSSVLALVVLPALAGGAIGVLLAPDSLASGFIGALPGPALALFVLHRRDPWRRPLPEAWIGAFGIIGLLTLMFGGALLDSLAWEGSTAPLFIILGVVVVLEGLVVFLETHPLRRDRRRT